MPHRSNGGPGTWLKRILGVAGYVEAAGCGCGVRAAELDLWGSDGVADRMPAVLAWFEGGGAWRQAGAFVAVSLAVALSRKRAD